MYIKLGSTTLNYPSIPYDDFMVFSEVIDSQVGYEKPILVRTIEQLDKWFGRDFTSRDYFEELINSGVTLLLTKPLGSYTNDLGIEFSGDGITVVDDIYTFNSLPTTTDQTKVYKVYNPNGTGEFTGTLGDTEITYDLYRWIADNESIPDGYYKKDDLPNIIKADSQSLNNRDTLRLFSTDNTTIYTHFVYSERENTGSTEEGSLNLSNLNLDRIELGYQTLVFDIVEREDLDNTLQENSYIIFPNEPTSDDIENTLYYHGNVDEIGVDSKYYKEGAKISFDSLDDLFGKLEGVEKVGNRLVANRPIDTTFFYEGLGIDLIPNYLETHHILDRYENSTDSSTDEPINNRIVDFWSKTIGTAGIDGNITVTIEESLDEGNYRVIIERFGHLEIFEGPIKVTAGIERLDYRISRLSELVYCDFAEGIEELPTGTWTLKGAIEETYNYESYNNGLDEIFEEADRTFPDFFLIPDPSLYVPERNTSDENIGEHEKFYKKVLRYAEESGCQVLVENGDTKNNYECNYTNDVFNRLVYFYRSMMLGDVSRPGYYIFIRGLLRDIYSMSTDIIYYKSIKDLSKDKNSYEEEPTVSAKLKEHKCNYLIDNGLMYYYKEYQNGDKFETSIWMRFVLGKIKRELEKNKWKYLGEKNQGKIRENISAILNKVSSNFGIIRDLSILDIRFHLESNKVDVDIETTISDLVKNHMIVNFTINYNKQDGKYSI